MGKLEVVGRHLAGGGAQIGLFVDGEVHTQVWIRTSDNNDEVAEKLALLAHEAKKLNELATIGEDD